MPKAAKRPGLTQALGAMKIAEFVKDRKQTIAWLASQQADLELQGHYFSDWSHNDGLGFGLVIVVVRSSGELHLALDGTVTYHVEAPDPATGNLAIVENVSRKPVTVDDFEYIYRRFKDLILGVAPNNSFKPRPLRGSA